ncbi:MAG: hypothetical protein ABII06_01030 [Pseudomonadota bacterium]
MEKSDPFIKAYHDFKASVDFTKKGLLPDLENLVCYLLMGVPRVPADDDPSDLAALEAVDQRIAILKAVFTELNQGVPDDFLDKGLEIYDLASERAKILLEEMNTPPEQT